MKKIIIIFSIVLGIVAVATGVYFAWKNSKQILTPPSKNEIADIDYGARQEVKDEKLKIISDQPVFDYWVKTATSSGEPEIFYVNQEGLIFSAFGGKNGAPETVSYEPIKNLQAVKKSKDGRLALVKFGSLTNPDFSIFDTDNNVWEPLNGATAADFSPDNKQIAYLESGGNLMVKNLNGSKQKAVKIVSVNQNDFDLSWVVKDKIFLVSRPSYQYVGEVWAVDLKTKKLNLLASGRGLMINWSQDGERGLMFKNVRERSYEMNLIDKSGSALAKIESIVLPTKCLVLQSKMYCAVSQGNNSFSGEP
ncbi:hypothetical protein HZB06_02255, partial [Candidatus Wolfebacteria bacterium]|nr:hypothetical protein [Candidatus Wolfebacteria bacterium]